MLKLPLLLVASLACGVRSLQFAHPRPTVRRSAMQRLVSMSVGASEDGASEAPALRQVKLSVPRAHSHLVAAVVATESTAAIDADVEAKAEEPKVHRRRKTKRSDAQVQEVEAPGEAGKPLTVEQQAAANKAKLEGSITSLQGRLEQPSRAEMVADRLGGKKGILIGSAGIFVTGYFASKAAQSLITKFKENQAKYTTNYAFEMIKYDGNTKQLTQIHEEYIKKIGPTRGAKKTKLFTEYVRSFFAKKTLSGAGIKSLTFVLSLFPDIKDENVADIFLKLSEEAAKKPIMRGKILFLAERLVSEPAALAKLQPIRDSIIETYESAEGMQIAQDFLAETSLKSFVGQKGAVKVDLAACIAEGRLLGVTKERATELFEEVTSPDFVSESDYYYKQKNEEPEDDPAAALRESLMKETSGDDDTSSAGGADDSAPSSSGSGNLIVECTFEGCGHTMFIAKGREFKFFGADYECPTCKSGKEFTKIIDESGNVVEGLV